jgi:hypothetical protein
MHAIGLKSRRDGIREKQHVGLQHGRLREVDIEGRDADFAEPMFSHVLAELGRDIQRDILVKTAG